MDDHKNILYPIYQCSIAAPRDFGRVNIYKVRIPFPVLTPADTISESSQHSEPGSLLLCIRPLRLFIITSSPCLCYAQVRMANHCAHSFPHHRHHGRATLSISYCSLNTFTPSGSLTVAPIPRRLSLSRWTSVAQVSFSYFLSNSLASNFGTG